MAFENDLRTVWRPRWVFAILLLLIADLSQTCPVCIDQENLCTLAPKGRESNPPPVLRPLRPESVQVSRREFLELTTLKVCYPNATAIAVPAGKGNSRTVG